MEGYWFPGLHCCDRQDPRPPPEGAGKGMVVRKLKHIVHAVCGAKQPVEMPA